MEKEETVPWTEYWKKKEQSPGLNLRRRTSQCEGQHPFVLELALAWPVLNPRFEETLEFKTCFKLNQNFENVILILKQEDLGYFEMRMGRQHWGMVTSEGEVCKS